MATQTGKDSAIPGTGGPGGTQARSDVVGPLLHWPRDRSAWRALASRMPWLLWCTSHNLSQSPTNLLPQGLAGAGPPEVKAFVQGAQEGPQGAPSAETQSKYGEVDKVRQWPNVGGRMIEPAPSRRWQPVSPFAWTAQAGVDGD